MATIGPYSYDRLNHALLQTFPYLICLLGESGTKCFYRTPLCRLYENYGAGLGAMLLLHRLRPGDRLFNLFCDCGVFDTAEMVRLTFICLNRHCRGKNWRVSVDR